MASEIISGIDPDPPVVKTVALNEVTVVGKSGSNISNGDDLFQMSPDRIDFVNTKTKAEKEKFLNSVTDWFGHVDKYGAKQDIGPFDIIDFYAKPKEKNEKSRGQKIIDFLEEIIGGDSSDHT